MPDKPWARTPAAGATFPLGASSANDGQAKPWDTDTTAVGGDSAAAVAQQITPSERPWQRAGVTHNGVPSTSQIQPYGVPVGPVAGSMYGTGYGSSYTSPYSSGYSPYGGTQAGYGSNYAPGAFGGTYAGSMYGRPGFASAYNGGMGSGVYGSAYGSGYSGYNSMYGGGYGMNGSMYGGVGGAGGMYGGGMNGWGAPAGLLGTGPGTGVPGMGPEQMGPSGGDGRTRWQVFMDGIQHLMHFFGRVSFLMDENAHAVHFFVTALLQMLDRASFLWGEVARFVLRLLGYKSPAGSKTGEGAAPAEAGGSADSHGAPPVKSLEAAWHRQ